MKTFLILTLILFSVSCNTRTDANDVFVGYHESKIDDDHFLLEIYSSRGADTCQLASDTIKGSLEQYSFLNPTWYEDSVICDVPSYFPSGTFTCGVHTTKVILRAER